MTAAPLPASRLRYLQPLRLAQALDALTEAPLTVLAGGTDLFAAREGELRADILDIGRVEGLRGLAADAGGWRIGALTTWSALLRCPLPAMFDGLKAAAREVGGLQVQNRGTLGGNLCNASPAADGIPPLLALDARVELVSAAGSRELSLRDFILGNRRTARRADELLTAVRVPARDGVTRSAFRKLGARRHLVISIASVAVTLTRDEAGCVRQAGVAVGACAPMAMRLAALEHRLIGTPPGGLAQIAIPDDDLEPLRPRDDIRGSADYRRAAVRRLVVDALRELGDG